MRIAIKGSPTRYWLENVQSLIQFRENGQKPRESRGNMERDYRKPREVMAVTAGQYSGEGQANEVTLNLEHPEYQFHRGAWQTIQELVSGGSVMSANRQKYLMSRVGEASELYAKRLQQFVYTPVLADAVRDLVKKLRTGMLNVNVTDPLIESSQKLYDNMELLGEVMRHWVLFGRCWTAIDADHKGVPLPKVISPIEVINWGYSEGQLDWVVVRTQEVRSRLFQPHEIVTIWTVTDRLSVKRYEMVKGSSAKLVTEYPLLRPGKCPFILNMCKGELWTGSQAYLKQLQHLWVENGVTDASTTLYIQRVIKPNPMPDDDLGESYLNSTEGGGVYSSNAHIIEGDFQFQEASGSSITVNMSLLGKIEMQIKAIVAMGAMESQGAIESGESKKYDYADYSATLAEYGHNLTVYYRRLLAEMIELTGGQIDTLLDVSGLDTFELSNVDTMLLQAEAIDKVAHNLSESALKTWYTDLSLQLAGSCPSALKDVIRKEVEAKEFGQPKPEPKPEPIQVAKPIIKK